MNQLNLRIEVLEQYSALCQEIKNWHEDKSTAQQQFEQLVKLVADIQLYISNYVPRIDFPVIESEVNDMLAKCTSTENLSQMRQKLNEIFGDIDSLVKEIISLRKDMRSIASKDNRHNAQAHCQAIEERLVKVSQLRINEVRPYIDRTIPELRNMLRNVLGEYEKEKIAILQFARGIEPRTLWSERYQALQDEIDAVHTDFLNYNGSLSLLSERYESARQEKSSDIDSLLAQYPKKVVEMARQHIQDMRNECVSKAKLHDLKMELDKAKKQYNAKLFKIGAIIAIVMVILLVNIAFFPVAEIIEAIIAGLVIYFKKKR